MGGAVLILVLLTLGTSLATGGISLSSDSQIDDYDESFDEEYLGVVTVHQQIDPWPPEAPEDRPSPGHRFVALEVIIENPQDSGDSIYASTYGFKLTDSENFAYAPTSSLIQPELQELELEPGEKTSGWVVFEVDESNPVKSVTHWSTEIALPQLASSTLR